jgi:hypothetical protein
MGLRQSKDFVASLIWCIMQTRKIIDKGDQQKWAFSTSSVKFGAVSVYGSHFRILPNGIGKRSREKLHFFSY